ncbi:nitric oxide-associated protein 1-like [Mizuhopecten yessoensis]|uniref:nitric oxide-associated protein 1-like n=1 Tax=Mizuhopecten yessoensis TaxID=6573 RepID=UPI000B459553|nr:nitric oxide-associated protein 1-like [Mizuhopecten yessoensis]
MNLLRTTRFNHFDIKNIRLGCLTTHLQSSEIFLGGQKSYVHISAKRSKTIKEMRELKLNKGVVKPVVEIDNVPSSVRAAIGKRKIELSEVKTDVGKREELTLDKLEDKLRSIQWDMNAILKKADESQSPDDHQIIEKDEESLDGFTEIVNIDPEKYSKRRKRKSRLTESTSLPDPSMPISDIPCRGCGAKLHCQNASLVGYICSSKLKSSTIEELQDTMCERCHLLRTRKVTLPVEVDEDQIPKLFESIRSERCLVLLILDLLDIRNSIPKNIVDLIGPTKDLYIVGSKVDMIPKDGDGFLERVESGLVSACMDAGIDVHASHVRHIGLISSLTGYGIENLVTKLLSDWELKGNVYFVGNMNAGKSTLFNALLRSDYCKFSARSGLPRATVADWPGTTVSVLKFPITTPMGWKLAKRAARFGKHRNSYQKELELRRSKAKEGNWKYASVAGIVAATDFRDEADIIKSYHEKDRYKGYDSPMYEYSADKVIVKRDTKPPEPKTKFDPKKYERAKWLCDTPGIRNTESMMTYLHPDELCAILPQNVMMPRPFLLQPGDVIFVTGLGRLDYLEGNSKVLITTFVNSRLPVINSTLAEADELYKENIGKDLFRVPIGDQDRLDKIPALVGKEFVIERTDYQTAAADIQMSSLGWVSVTVLFGEMGDPVKVKVYTPGGKGLYMRCPALLPYTHTFKGKRIKHTQRYRIRKPLV